MIITYSLNQEDFWEYLLSMKKIRFKKSIKKMTIYTIVLSIITTVLFYREEYPLIFIEIMIFAIYIPIFFYNRSILKKRVMNRFQEGDGILGEHTIEILEDGFRESTLINDSFHRWIGVETIDSNVDFIVIMLKNSTFLLIPKKSAFSSIEDAINFEQCIKNLFNKNINTNKNNK
ncbi:hypothetical protein QFZ77_004182 [Paenibacillus sp. V4I3]|uniref:hypothetical protein n=1 Tax=unclassified Paenibacillus TaxID=185978 RepID=UPI00278263F8|nr:MULTISPECIES: hypothetical protein [unclassified Paenibacillus]MDQ0875523.1 hypothetical protein [Paenibacillus sp. V4I3]MDQ0888396.1 hypothetical protein [Paenibacillus sp. V4I9]